MSKKINIDEIDFSKLKFFINKRIFTNYIFFVIIFLFIGSYIATLFLFSSKFVFNSFIPQNGYSKNCIKLLEEDKSFLNDMQSLYKKHQGKEILPIYFNNMPKTLGTIKDIKAKKRLFINILLPIFLKNYEELLTERNSLLYINNKLLSRPLVEQDFLLIKQLASKYKVQITGEDFWDYTKALDELLLKVDVIPISLTIAVAAKETGWGVSRFLLEGNALFAEWVWNDGGIIPQKRSSKYTYSVKKFHSLADAVKSYSYNLNTHRAYTDFRKYRSRREELNYLKVNQLARQLFNYSNDKNYTEALIKIMRQNKLYQYDSLQKIDTKYNKICFDVL